MKQIINYIKPELVVVAVVLYFIGSAITMAMFTAITQGILAAGLSTYVNQLFKQAGKEKELRCRNNMGGQESNPNPQLENRYTRIANELIDAIGKIELNDRAKSSMVLISIYLWIPKKKT